MWSKINIGKTILVLSCIYGACLHAQVDAETIKMALSQSESSAVPDAKQWKQIQLFYAIRNFDPAWINDVYVSASNPIAVHVSYNPAGIDAAGNLLFFEDVYRKFNWRK